MNFSHLLYIGLNGLAGSGKDTMAKMLYVILNYDWKTMEDAFNFYNSYHSTNIQRYATFNNDKSDNQKVMCVAFADQLKYICSSMFGIPVDRFYHNKGTSWICINKDFEYTENEPLPEYLISADDYYNRFDFYTNSNTRYYMSLRDVLVYVGTYICQRGINRNVFVNIVRNTIKEQRFKYHNLQYVILTDIRFNHEKDYCSENNGITIKVVRDSIEQLDNIAEHELDDDDNYDYIIENNGSYQDLFKEVWDLVHDDIIFQNQTEMLYTRDDSNSYIRLVNNVDENVWELCTEKELQRISRNEGRITLLDPIGGPTIEVGEPIPGTDVVPYEINIDENDRIYIYAE